VAIALRRGGFAYRAVASSATGRPSTTPKTVQESPDFGFVSTVAVLIRAGAGVIHAVPSLFWLEWLCAILVACLLLAGAYAGWRFSTDVLQPARPAFEAPSLTPRGVLASDRQAVKDFQAALEAAGEANAYLLAKKYDWARETVDRALRLDPQNPTALSVDAQLKLQLAAQRALQLRMQPDQSTPS